jgi:hypothetical protein
MSINFGGVPVSKANFNQILRQVDTVGNKDGTVTIDELKKFQAEFKGFNPTVDQFCSTLLGNGPDSFSNLMKVAGTTDGLRYAPSADKIDNTDVGKIYNRVEANRQETPSIFKDTDKLNTLIRAAGNGTEGASLQDLRALRDSLASLPSKTLLGTDLDASLQDGQELPTKRNILGKSFKTAGEAKEALDAFLDDKNKALRDAVDVAGAAPGSKADGVFNFGDTRKYKEQQLPVDDAARQLANANPLKEGNPGVYKKTSTQPIGCWAFPMEGNPGVYKKTSTDKKTGITKTSLYGIDADGNLRKSVTETNSTGQLVSVSTTITDKDGHTTGTRTFYDADGNVKGSEAIDRTVKLKGGKLEIPADAEPTNSEDIKDRNKAAGTSSSKADGKPKKLAPGQGDGKGPEGPGGKKADNFYAISDKNGEKDWVENVIRRERKTAGLKTDNESISKAVELVRKRNKKNGIDIDRVGNGTVIDLRPIYWEKTEG